MSTPDFIVRLRRKIGHDLLLLPGVVAIVHNDAAEVLMVRRRDTGRWHLPSGIVEPGEHPSETIVREVAEETGLTVAVDGVAAVVGRRRTTYPNGDECEFVSTLFRCSVVGGELMPDGEEIIDACYFDPSAPEVVAYAEARHFPLNVITGDDGVYFPQPS